MPVHAPGLVGVPGDGVAGAVEAGAGSVEGVGGGGVERGEDRGEEEVFAGVVEAVGGVGYSHTNVLCGWRGLKVG